MEKPFTEAQINYGADDIIFPFQLKKLQEKGRTLHDGFEYKPIRSILFQSSLTRILAYIELRGVKVDIQGWVELSKKNKKILIYRKQILDSWVIKHFPDFTLTDLFNVNGTCNIDWNSSKSVIQFTKFLKICPKAISKQTNRLEYTVGAKEVFYLLSNKNKENFILGKRVPLIDKDDFDSFWLNYLLFKKASQLVNTFGESWLTDYIHPITRKVHTNYISLMNTGRMSSTSPNLQLRVFYK